MKYISTYQTNKIDKKAKFSQTKNQKNRQKIFQTFQKSSFPKSS